MVNCEQKRSTYLRKTGNRSPAVANAANPLAKTAFRDNAITIWVYEEDPETLNVSHCKQQAKDHSEFFSHHLPPAIVHHRKTNPEWKNLSMCKGKTDMSSTCEQLSYDNQ